MSKETSKLLLLGIGGGGGRLAAAVRSLYAGDMRVLCMDTDALSNREIQQGADIPCILFGGARLSGNGAGGDPILGREAFRDDAELLEPHLAGVRTVIILTCLGGGTGGGATPEVARLLKEKGIATLCIATRPFRFEGQKRQEETNRVYPQIEVHADSLAEVCLDDLFEESAQDMTLGTAIAAADSLLASGVTLLWRMLSSPGFICADPERLHSLVVHGGDVRFGSAMASGDNRAAHVTGMLKSSRLLRGSESLRKAKALLVGILGGVDLRLAEIGGIMKTLRGWHPADCRVELGTVLDPELEGRVEVVVFAFENSALSGAPEEPPVLAPELLKRKQPKGTEPTIWNGENLDIPTYLRRNLRLDR